MFKMLRWIEGTDWRTVLVLSFISSFTLSLVFAGTVNDSIDYRMPANVHSVQSIEGYTPSLPLANRHEGLTSFTSQQSDTTHTHDEISLLLDLSKNLLRVMRGNQVIHTALAATGSGKVLLDPQDPSRKWKFETPRGSFTIKNKLKKPVWIRPDWAFIEKGVPIPKDRKHRLLPNALGDYALGFGDGYFIHGALYTYLLGFNVTHGCIQLNDEDLRFVFKAVPLGATLVII